MNPYLIIGALAAVIVSFLGGGWVGYDIRAGKVPAELLAQQDTDTKACDKSQALTKGSNDDLQKDRDTIAAKLAALSVQHPAACVSVARTSHIRASGDKHAGQDGNSPATGLNTDWLRSYAADAETYRSELTVCEDFLQKERKELTQPGQ
jgi:hypothetical protein